MTINFYLDRYLADNNEKSIVCYVRGIEKQKTIYLNTGIKVKPDDWNSESQKVRRGNPNYSEINALLDKIKADVQKLQIEFIRNQQMEFNSFKMFLKNNLFADNSSKTSFFDIYDLFIKTRSEVVKPSSLWTFHKIRSELKEIEKIHSLCLSFNSINASFGDIYIEYLLNVEQNTNNTIFTKVKKLKRFMNWAKERGYHNNIEYKNIKRKEEEVDIIYLTNDELNRVYELDLSNNKVLEQVRDIFCFSCFTGQRFADIISLDFKDIRGNSWFLRTNKTRDTIEIPLSSRALKIVDKYQQFNGFYKFNNQIYNNHLREIGKLTKIEEPIKRTRYRGKEVIEETKPKYEFMSSHLGRRTFVTLSLEKGIRPEIVMRVTGHKDYKTLQRYIKITSKVTKEEMLRAWE